MSDDWTLTPDQLVWMVAHCEIILDIYNRIALRELGKFSDGFADVFGDMSWDEAYDRYETMTEQDA